MSENKVVWHPYPEEPACTEDYFLVTLETKQERFIGILWTKDGLFNKWERENEGYKVVAWAEVPESYKGDKE